MFFRINGICACLKVLFNNFQLKAPNCIPPLVFSTEPSIANLKGNASNWANPLVKTDHLHILIVCFPISISIWFPFNMMGIYYISVTTSFSSLECIMHHQSNVYYTSCNFTKLKNYVNMIDLRLRRANDIYNSWDYLLSIKQLFF